MAGSLNRTFSFNDNDETSLHSNRQDRSLYPQPYQDVPSQDIGVSPISRNDSPPPRNYTISPPSPPPHYSVTTSNPTSDFQRRQPSIPRRPLPLPIATTYQQNDHSPPHGQAYPASEQSLTTPGADNLGESTAGGGIAGIAFGVAHTNERDSGVQALRSMYGPSQQLPERGYSPVGTDNPYIPDPDPLYRSRNLQQHDSYSSIAPLTAAAATPGHLTPQSYDAGREMAQNSYPQERDLGSGRRSAYIDNPYQGYSSAWDPRVDQGEFDPNEIDDDGDDGMLEPRKRRSVMGLGRGSDQSIPMGAVAGGAAAGGILGGLGNIGRKAVGSRSDPSGQYGPVTAPGVEVMRQEKLDYAQRQISRRKRLRWIFGILGALVIIGIIVGAVAGVLTNQKKNSTKASGVSPSPDDGTDLDKNSPEILKLLGNTNLHKVFPGIDYTPYNSQYPDCLNDPPSQNNVTRDMAVLSQLTNAVRLYGTDCNQTEMVLHAINKLSLTDMKIWLGIWVGDNTTTNGISFNLFIQFFYL